MDNKIWCLFLVLGLLRMEQNLFIKPEINEHSEKRVYRDNIKKLTSMIDEPLLYLGEKSMDINRAFGVTDTLFAPQHMPYAIPYYYTLHASEPLRIVESTEAGKLYIARELVPNEVDTLFQFQRKGHEPWVVFRAK